MKEYKVIIGFPVEYEYLEYCNSEEEAYTLGKDLAITDAVALAGTRGIKTWENIWNENIDEVLDMTLEDGTKFINSKFEDYINSIVKVTIEEV